MPAAADEFDAVLRGRPNQLDRQLEAEASSDALLDVPTAGGAEGITEEGLRGNVNVAIQYISSWLRGKGAAGIYGLMEDAATAEICRSQVWQWLYHGCSLGDDRPIDRELVEQIEDEELERIRSEIGDDEWFETEGRPRQSRELFEEVALATPFVEFLTVPAYERLP